MPDIKAKPSTLQPIQPPIDISDLFPDYARAEVTSIYKSIISVELHMQPDVFLEHRVVIRMDTNWLLNSLEKIRRGTK